jgi:hypothetical protein
MRIAPQVIVPFSDEDGTPCQFVFVQPARAIAALLPCAPQFAQRRIDTEERRVGRSLSVEEQTELLSAVQVSADDVGALDAVFFAALCDVFAEGCVGWSGVCDDTGAPLDCTASNRAAVPVEVQVVVASAYLVIREALQKKGPSPVTPPTSP